MVQYTKNNVEHQINQRNTQKTKSNRADEKQRNIEPTDHQEKSFKDKNFHEPNLEKELDAVLEPNFSAHDSSDDNSRDDKHSNNEI
ncbi:hypothetical protein A0H76_2336 [Hepatospora eriocheir]|uniref:Uncharacterized protein n=1 Tax=Hepatospora eriocheir TaxID=1081669 RepID=A0A1X0QJW9_9MICR|nr:hypothetical protein A0H76_2336 [Hepatospora eriocheir]